MADSVYQHRPGEASQGERLADMVFVYDPEAPRVDSLMLIDGCCMIIGVYLAGRYAGKRCLICMSYNRRKVVERWNRRYGKSADATTLERATPIPYR